MRTVVPPPGRVPLAAPRLDVCLYTPSADPSGMGGHLLDLAREHLPHGEVTVMAWPTAPGRRLLDRAASLGAHTVAMPHPRDPSFAASVTEALRRRPVDVFHAHVGFGREDFDGVRAARAAGVGAVVQTQHLAWLLGSHKHRRPFFRGLRDVDHVVTVSGAQQDTYARIGVPRALMTTIPNGVHPRSPGPGRAAARAALGLPVDARVVLAVGRLVAIKGHRHLVDAAALLAPDVHVVVVGGGHLEQSLRDRAATLGAADRVHLAGHRPDARALLDAADVAVLPSLLEGMPLTLLEAMDAGLPVVATRVIGSTEVVEDGVTGLSSRRGTPRPSPPPSPGCWTTPRCATASGRRAAALPRALHGRTDGPPDPCAVRGGAGLPGRGSEPGAVERRRGLRRRRAPGRLPHPARRRRAGPRPRDRRRWARPGDRGVVVALLGGDPGALLQDGSPAPSSSGSDLEASCRTGADADRDADCRVVALENSLTRYWSGAVEGFAAPSYTLFEGSVQTGCGAATAAVGPLLLPRRPGRVPRPGFFTELRTTYGAQGGDFAEAYVLAHEYGHHVQNLPGRARAQRSAEQTGPRTARPAWSCRPTAWPACGRRTRTGRRVTFDDGRHQRGPSAAAAVGDDRIQEKATGRVDPESWTHGSAEQRQHWFTTGLEAGAPDACDTFRGSV